MENRKEDRRVERTRMLLHEALMALILEKGYESVTVQDILDRANLGRSTFYSHYRDKDDLFLKGFDHLQTMLEKQQSQMADKTGGKSSEFNLSLELFRHAQQNYRLYKALVGKHSGHMVMTHAHTLLSDVVRQYLEPYFKDKNKLVVSPEILAHWLASSFLSLLTWWLDNNLPHTAEKMDEIFRQLTMPGLETVLGHDLAIKS